MSEPTTVTAWWVDDRQRTTFVLIGHHRFPLLAFARMGAREAVWHFLEARIRHAWYVTRDFVRGVP